MTAASSRSATPLASSEAGDASEAPSTSRMSPATSWEAFHANLPADYLAGLAAMFDEIRNVTYVESDPAPPRGVRRPIVRAWR